MPQVAGIVQKLPPAAGAEGTGKIIRVDQFGAPHVRTEILAWLEGAEYFKVSNPTWGTGIGMGIQTTFSDTANVLLLMRNGSASKVIIPHYFRFINTVAGASTTSSHLGIVLDTGNRYSTGGTDLLAQVVNAHSGQAPASVVDVLRFAAVTALAAVAKRQVARAVLKTLAAPCWVLGDEVFVYFDVAGGGAGGGQFIGGAPANVAASAASRLIVPMGPLLLGGQNHCMLIHMWNPANATTAPSWEVEGAWWEKSV